MLINYALIYINKFDLPIKCRYNYDGGHSTSQRYDVDWLSNINPFHIHVVPLGLYSTASQNKSYN